MFNINYGDFTNCNTMKIIIEFNNGKDDAYIFKCPYSVSDTAIKNKVYSLYPKNTVNSIYRERCGFLALVK